MRLNNRDISLILISCFLLPNAAWAQDEFPYSRKKVDFVLGGAASALMITSELLDHRIHNLTLDQIESLKPEQVNKLDRVATRQWSTSWQKFSDIPNKALRWTPALVLLPELKPGRWDNAFTLGVIYVETLFLTTSVTNVTKSLAGRTRPYLYNLKFTSQERFDLQGNGAPVGNTSFFSGHTANTFAFAFLVSKLCTDIYGNKFWCKLVWFTSVGLAASTAYARVKAGVHYPTDVLTGAVVGGAIGFFVPTLHKNKEKESRVSLSFFPRSFSLRYKL